MRFAVLPLLLLATPIGASTPAAQSANARAATVACLKASGLVDARLASEPVGFDDRAGYDALLVTGRWPQPHMQGKQGTMLCLWHRATKRAVVSEAPGWRVR